MVVGGWERIGEKTPDQFLGADEKECAVGFLEGRTLSGDCCTRTVRKSPMRSLFRRQVAGKLEELCLQMRSRGMALSLDWAPGDQN